MRRRANSRARIGVSRSAGSEGAGASAPGGTTATVIDGPPSDGAAPKELVVFRGRKRITWIGVPPAAGCPAELAGRPGVADEVSQPSVALADAGASRSGQKDPLNTWFEDLCAGASYALLYGPQADPLAHRLEKGGCSPQVVRCHGRPDALRAARVLACPGDTVVATASGMLILPDVAYYWQQQD